MDDLSKDLYVKMVGNVGLLLARVLAEFATITKDLDYIRVGRPDYVIFDFTFAHIDNVAPADVVRQLLQVTHEMFYHGDNKAELYLNLFPEEDGVIIMEIGTLGGWVYRADPALLPIEHECRRLLSKKRRLQELLMNEIGDELIRQARKFEEFATRLGKKPRRE